MQRRNFIKRTAVLSAAAFISPRIFATANSYNAKKEIFKGFIVSDSHFGWAHKMQPTIEEQAAAVKNILNKFPDLDIFLDTGDAHHYDHHNNANPHKARKDWVDIIQDMWVARKGHWKLLGNPRDTGKKIVKLKEKRFLVNLDDDIGETKNLAKKYPNKVLELENQYRNWLIKNKVKMKNLSNILLLSLILIGCSSSKLKPIQETKQPNILFIMSDDHTRQAWGIYGGILKDHVQNINIERLASEGVVLENCLVSNSICTPSRATILTGQYSHRNGITTLGKGLDPEYNNIAKELGKGGYQTSIIGKWHLKQEPSGFDYYCVLPGQGLYNNPIMKTKENWKDYNKGGEIYEGFSADIIADKTINWIENRDKSKPFMSFCHFKATHEPYDYPERLSYLYRNEKIPEPATLYDNGPNTTGRSLIGQSIDNLGKRFVFSTNNPDKRSDYMQYPELPFSIDGLSKKEARSKVYQKFVKDFMRCGAAIDDNIGKLLDYLEASGLDENTIVIYTADQGYFLGEHGWFDKRLIYEESIHMPFVIRYPKEIPAGKRNKDIIENVDFSALFADYAGIKYPENMQGKSFRENLKGNTSKDWRQYGYYRYWQHQKDRPGHFGIRGKRYKLAFYYGKGFKNNHKQADENTKFWDFYDLQKDPNELHNAYKDSTYQKVITKLKKELLKQRELLGDTDKDSKKIQNSIKTYWDSTS